MPTNGKVVINLATGLEDPERVTLAFLVGGAAAQAGKEVTMFLTKEAVRLSLPHSAQGVACDGCPPLPTLAAVCRRRWADARLLDLLQRAKTQPAGSDRRSATRRARPHCGNGSTKAPRSLATDEPKC